MALLPTSLDWFTLLNGLTSIVGFLISLWTLLVAKSVKRRVDEVKLDLIARVRTDEIVNDIGRSLPRLARALSSDRVDAFRHQSVYHEQRGQKPGEAEPCGVWYPAGAFRASWLFVD
jgi:hypothetical protein